MKRIQKWLWIRLNKKRPTSLGAYWTVMSTGLFVGTILGYGIILALTIYRDGEGIVWAGIAVILISLAGAFSGWLLMKADRDRGLVDDIHEAYLKYWHRRNKECGIEEQ